MSSPTYYSAIYTINRSKKKASMVCIDGYNCDFLPKTIKLNEMANLVANMQKICFKDDNENNENSDRLQELFASTKDKTIAIALTLGYQKGVTDYNDFIDGGSATIQMSNQDGLLSQQQPWLNEVCRSKRLSQQTPSPVQKTMNLIDKYITDILMQKSSKIKGLYLYVEKSPEHGDPDFLLKYYNKYGFKEFLLGHQEDEDYYYMKKIYLEKSPSLRKSKSKSKSKSPSKTRKLKSTVKAYTI